MIAARLQGHSVRLEGGETSAQKRVVSLTGVRHTEVLKGELSSPLRVQKLIWLQKEPGPDPLRLLKDATVVTGGDQTGAVSRPEDRRSDDEDDDEGSKRTTLPVPAEPLKVKQTRWMKRRTGEFSAAEVKRLRCQTSPQKPENHGKLQMFGRRLAGKEPTKKIQERPKVLKHRAAVQISVSCFLFPPQTTHLRPDQVTW